MTYVNTIMVKNGVFWDVTPFGFFLNRRFGGTHLLRHQGENNRRATKNICCN
jgi:hypothetical protein